MSHFTRCLGLDDPMEGMYVQDSSSLCCFASLEHDHILLYSFVFTSFPEIGRAHV